MKSVRRFVWCALAVVGLAGAVCAYRLFSPPDRVRVFVDHLPAGAKFVCLVASGADGDRCLDWSPSNELGVPFEVHPAKCGWSYRSESDSPRLNWDAYVRWVPARNYGVVILGEDGAWRALWFSTAEVSPSGMWGGRAKFDCQGRAATPLPEAAVRDLGLGEVTAKP